MSPWFKREKKKVTTPTKREIPDGVWDKCNSCQETLYRKELERNLEVCPKCGNHFRYSSGAYIELLLDPGSWTEHDDNLISADPLGFKDKKSYSDRIQENIKKSRLTDAIRCLSGRLAGQPVQLAVMDFAFMGGSVGSVVGERLCRAIMRAVDTHSPLVIISCSGGMRMQEGILSLMQMAKVSAALVRLEEKRQPFISVMVNPTTGGTTASYAMLGDVNIAEPGALIGFAGPRVIKQTIGEDLPKGFQSSEFLEEHGFLDMIVPRAELKKTIATLLGLLLGKERISAS